MVRQEKLSAFCQSVVPVSTQVSELVHSSFLSLYSKRYCFKAATGIYRQTKSRWQKVRLCTAFKYFVFISENIFGYLATTTICNQFNMIPTRITAYWPKLGGQQNAFHLLLLLQSSFVLLITWEFFMILINNGQQLISAYDITVCNEASLVAMRIIRYLSRTNWHAKRFICILLTRLFITEMETNMPSYIRIPNDMCSWRKIPFLNAFPTVYRGAVQMASSVMSDETCLSTSGNFG